MKNYQQVIALANQDDAQSQCELALMFEWGLGTDKNLVKAFAWYQKSAKQNNAKAQYNLGIFYALGKGCKKDIKCAKDWIKKAHDNGYSGGSIF